MESNYQINQNLPYQHVQQEEKLKNKFSKGNEILKRNLDKIKKSIEKKNLHSNVNYDVFNQNPNIDFKEKIKKAIEYSQSNYENKLLSKNILKEKTVSSPSHYRQESTSEITIERSTKVNNNLSYKELKNKLTEGSAETDVIFPKTPRDENFNNFIIENQNLFNDYNNFEDNITQSKSNNKKKNNNIKKNNITAPLKNKKLQRKIKQNSFLNSNNIKSKIENLKRPKSSLKNSNIFNTNQKRTRNSNKYENTLYNNIDSKNRISQEQYNLTNQGNYNSHYNTNYNTNYNTTSSNYIRETNPSMSKEKYLNTYSSNEQNNNINNKYYNTTSYNKNKKKKYISQKKDTKRCLSGRNNLTDRQKEYIDLKNEVNLLKKQKQFLKSSINNIGYKKSINDMNKNIKSKRASTQSQLNKILDYDDLVYLEKKIIGTINEETKNEIAFTDAISKNDDFGKHINQVIDKSLKGYKYRYCNNCSKLLIDGKHCAYCQKRHHYLNFN